MPVGYMCPHAYAGILSNITVYIKLYKLDLRNILHGTGHGLGDLDRARGQVWVVRSYLKYGWHIHSILHPVSLSLLPSIVSTIFLLSFFLLYLSSLDSVLLPQPPQLFICNISNAPPIQQLAAGSAPLPPPQPPNPPIMSGLWPHSTY